MIFSFAGGLARVRDSLWTIGTIVLAATISYTIARYGLSHPVPLLAVTVAISSLGFARDTRPDRVLTTAVAMVLGVALSETLLIVYGSGVLQLFFAIGLSLLLARLISANPAFALTVALQAVLVQLLQEPTGGVFARAIDGVVGAAVALLFTALLPRNPIKLARADARELFEIFKNTLADIRSALTSNDVALADSALERIRKTQPLVDNWKSSLESAEAISKISPFYRWATKEVASQLVVMRAMDLATRNLRVLARRVDFVVRDGRSREQLASLVSKLIIAVDLIESATDDFSMSQKARKYVSKLTRQLDPASFDPPLSISDVAVLMQIRPLSVDLCQAAGLDVEKAKELLPKVD